MSQGVWGLQPPDSGKTIIFRAKAKFFRQKPAAKMKKKVFCIY